MCELSHVILVLLCINNEYLLEPGDDCAYYTMFYDFRLQALTLSYCDIQVEWLHLVLQSI